jgi:hypothetical protein
MLVALIVVSTLGFITGCGSGASLTSAATQPATTTGTYAITITATGGSTVQDATLKLTIQ